VIVPVDPQQGASGFPNFYLYVIRGSTYSLAVHTSKKFPFGRTDVPRNGKVEVSNVANRKLGIWKFKELLKMGAFQKSGFFRRRGEEQELNMEL